MGNRLVNEPSPLSYPSNLAREKNQQKLKRENQILNMKIVRRIAASLMVALVSFMLALYITLDTLETVLPPGSAVWLT
jgi:hypothetical protein